MSRLETLVPRRAAARVGPVPGAVAVTRAAPHVRDAFSLERAMRCVIVALVPSLFMAFYNTGLQANARLAGAGLETAPGWRGALLDALSLGADPSSFWSAIAHGALVFVPVLAVTAIVGDFWERLFARLRNRPRGEGLTVIVLLFALSLPPSIPWWQAALGASFAVVVGREIFGGTGRNFLNPALVGLAFLYVTYPSEAVSETAWTVVDAFTAPTDLQAAALVGGEAVAWLGTTWIDTFVGLVPGAFGATSTLACLLGAVYLLARGVVSTRVILGILFGMIATAWLVNQVGAQANAFAGISWYWHLTLGSFAFGTVFLATDPVSAAMTSRGRWIYGLLIGVMVVLIRVGHSAHPDGVMFAILLGNIFAPLIDHLVVRANIRRRARRGG